MPFQEPIIAISPFQDIDGVRLTDLGLILIVRALETRGSMGRRPSPLFGVEAADCGGRPSPAQPRTWIVGLAYQLVNAPIRF